MVEKDFITIQSSTNPHIILNQLYPKEIQLKILEEAKAIIKITQKIGNFDLISEDTEYPICLYPSPRLLEEKRDLNEFGNAVYTKRLALAEPHLKPIFFEIEVLERYLTDPRFEFKFDDYSGKISLKCDENGNPIVREEDQVYLKTFGLGYDDSENRLAVVYLGYLKNLTEEHQIYWKSKEIQGTCKILKEYYDNTILGEFTSSFSFFSAFIGEMNCLNQLSITIFNIPLFRCEFDRENRPKEFTFFFTPTSKNYYDFVLLLDKIISDNINKNFFKNKISLFEMVELSEGIFERRPKGTIQLFEEWILKSFHCDKTEELKDIFKSFRKIRYERQNPAHKIDENKYDKVYIQKQIELITEAYNSMRLLRNIFQQHPKAVDIKIPRWLEEGSIKAF